MCLNAICGDMVVYQNFEQCDDGNMDDTDGCVQGCLTATCGDMFVQANVEDCDDANMVNTDACVACSSASCGDGFVQMGVEVCDDGNNDDMDGCSSTCQTEFKLVFVTSTLHTANLGGLAGADGICQARAAAANLPGTYMAWLSTNLMNGTPATRFAQSVQPYRKVDGVLVANNWADLIDGTLASPINKTELNGNPPIGNTGCAGGGFATVWSATNGTGALINAASTCTNWTSTNGGSYWGLATDTSGNWTAWCSGGSCSWTSPIYCFQQ
jgi:cysteine-rich repeat protein